jgi:hypothetical protein
MGAWDCGIFDDDTAYDWFDEIAEDARAFFAGSFKAAISADYVDYDLAHRVTVSAAYMDNLLNGTLFRNDNDGQDDITNVNQFGNLCTNLDVSDLKKDAIAALQKVLGDRSELNELWSENKTLYPRWRQNLLDVVERLS